MQSALVCCTWRAELPFVRRVLSPRRDIQSIMAIAQSLDYPCPMRNIRTTALALTTAASLIAGGTTVAVADTTPVAAVSVAENQNANTTNANATNAKKVVDGGEQESGSISGYAKPLALAAAFAVLIGAIVAFGDMAKAGNNPLAGLLPPR